MMDPCPHEDAVASAARSGEWTPELEGHLDECLDCSELAMVVAALGHDATALVADDTPPPDPSMIWLRAQLASRERDLHRATRAIVWVQRAAVAVAVAVGLAVAPIVWRAVRGGLASFDLASTEMPRAVGSPLLVVVSSMLVLGILAFFELVTPAAG